MSLFQATLAVLILGALASLLAGRSRLGNTIGPLAALAGSLLGLGAVGAGPWAGIVSVTLPWGLPFGAGRLGLDPLSRLFLLPVFVLGGLCALSGRVALAHDQDKNRGAHWFFYLLLVAAMAVVLTARDAILFLVAWEIMSLAPFFLISFHDEQLSVRDASWIYLVAAHLGAVLLLVFFTLLWQDAGSTDFAAFVAAGLRGGPAAATALFLLALGGFGAKAGIIPLHVWLPEAHPAAPSHVSAFLSGAMINAGLYGILRSLAFLGPIRPGWGGLVLALGLVSGLLGILQALGQSNIKRMLAYSSVENMGIILLGLGAGMIGVANANAAIAFLGFGGALFHVLNHAAFKGLLFLGAGELLHAAGTVQMDRLGGLQKRLPATGVLFLLGCAGIMGLPPFPSFAGELLLYLGLAHGGELPGLISQMGLLAALCGLAAIGGLALFCFAKAYGIVFLGEPRSEAARTATAPGPAALAPLAVLALYGLLAGLFAPAVFELVAPAAFHLAGGLGNNAAGPALASAASGILAKVALLGLGVVVASLLVLLLRRRLLAGRSVRQGRTWDCGYAAPDARMQYSDASLSEPLSKELGSAMGLHLDVSSPRGYFPKRGRLSVTAPDRLQLSVFVPIFEAARQVCDAVKLLQHGQIHLYILYILAVLVALLLWKL